MKLMDKMKKILFDEEEVELPVQESVSKKDVKQNGFIDHSKKREEQAEEDIIKEIKVPPYEEKEEKTEENKFDFSNKFDFTDEDLVSSYSRIEKPVEEKKFNFENTRSRFDFNEPLKEESPKDISTEKLKEKEHEKKPFRVSPTISPVYGIIDKNYVPDTPVSPKKVTVPPVKKRSFGPVSYNDDLIMDTPKMRSETVKEEIKEVNEIVENMIEDENIPDNSKIEDIKTSGIENEYIDHTNIEDAFESTSEFNKIKENDEIVENKEELTEENIITVDEENKDDEHLDDTIETDLFNLIDSMYSSEGKVLDSEDD